MLTYLVAETLTKTNHKSIFVVKAVKDVAGDYIKNSIIEYQKAAREDVRDIDTGHQIVAEYDTDGYVFDLLRPRLPIHVELFKVIIDLDSGKTPYLNCTRFMSRSRVWCMRS
jgi:hypothetical protein